jgi:tRNA(Ile2) C34 agmatinyltransferase TiaS
VKTSTLADALSIYRQLRTLAADLQRQGEQVPATWVDMAVHATDQAIGTKVCPRCHQEFRMAGRNLGSIYCSRKCGTRAAAAARRERLKAGE